MSDIVWVPRMVDNEERVTTTLEVAVTAEPVDRFTANEDDDTQIVASALLPPKRHTPEGAALAREKNPRIVTETAPDTGEFILLTEEGLLASTDRGPVRVPKKYGATPTVAATAGKEEDCAAAEANLTLTVESDIHMPPSAPV